MNTTAIQYDDFALIGHSLGYGLMLYLSHKVELDSLCVLIVETDGELTYLTYDNSDIRESHKKAADYLRDLEELKGYDRATITYDGYVTLDGIREESLITQLFTLNSFANRRASIAYHRENGLIHLDGEAKLSGEWDEHEYQDNDVIHQMNESMLKTYSGGMK